jgi:hypothetical protein
MNSNTIRQNLTSLCYNYFIDDSRLLAIKQLFEEGEDNFDTQEIQIGFCRCAASENHIKSLRYLHETLGCSFGSDGCSFGSDVGYYSIHEGGIDCFRYLHECGMSITSDMVSHFAASGNIEGLRYCYERGVSWPLKICEYAARNGCDECLRYVHKHGAQWTQNTTNVAIECAIKHGYYWKCVYYACECGFEPTNPAYLTYWNEINETMSETD